MDIVDQFQTVTVAKKDESIDLKSIDSKFLEIKNRLKDQIDSSKKKPAFTKEFYMEQISAFEKNQVEKNIENQQNSQKGVAQKNISDKQVLSGINGNIQTIESEVDFSVAGTQVQNEKENKQILHSYQSTFRQIQDIPENTEFQKSSDNEPFSASEYSKMASTYVILPQKGDLQSTANLQKIQQELSNKCRILGQKKFSYMNEESLLSQTIRDQNSTKYNYLNECQLSFKEEETNQFQSELASSQENLSQRYSKFSKILSQQEINCLSQDEKKEYIRFLKKEINEEIKKEFRFKQLEDEQVMLNRNFKLEKELLQTEHDNRKLQIWILEDKKKQVELEYQTRLNEKIEFDGQIKDMKEKIQETNYKQNQIDYEINQQQTEIENAKISLEKLYQQKESLEIDQQQLQTELQEQSQCLSLLDQNKQNIQKIYDINCQNVQQSQKIIEELKNNFQYKETSNYGLKKEMRRIEDDILEANQIKGTIKEEKDMFETQLSFLKKQKIILERDIENHNKKKKFEDEFIHYGDKNNHSLFDCIKDNKHIIDELKQKKVQTENENQILQKNIQLSQKQIEQVNHLILFVQDNINQIIQVTNFQDELFKDEDKYEEIRAKLLNLCRKPNLAYLLQNNIDEQSQISQKYKRENNQSSLNTMKNLKNTTQQQSSQQRNNQNTSHSRISSCQDNQLNTQNYQETQSAQLKLKQMLDRKNLEIEDQPTKRIFSERGMSPIDLESKNSNGFMGLGKSYIDQNQGKNIDTSMHEIDDQYSEITEDVARMLNNENQCNHMRNIEKLSYITQKQKVQSPFTVRSILGTQNHESQDNKSNNESKQQNVQQNTEIPQKLKNYKQSKQQYKNGDLKLFLTKANDRINQKVLEQIQDNKISQERLSTVNQIRSCSPLKQISQLKPQKLSTESSSQVVSARKIIVPNKQIKKRKITENNEEIMQFNEIQKQNHMLKNGQIKQVVYIGDSFFEQDQKQKRKNRQRSTVKSMNAQELNQLNLYQQYQDQQFATQSQFNYLEQTEQCAIPVQKLSKQFQNELQKQSSRKIVKKQFQTIQNQQDYYQKDEYQIEYPQFQHVIQDDEYDFLPNQEASLKNRAHQNNQFYQNIKSEPFKKRSISPRLAPAQYSSRKPEFAQAVKNNIFNGQYNENKEQIIRERSKSPYQIELRQPTQCDSKKQLKTISYYANIQPFKNEQKGANQKIEKNQQIYNKKIVATASKIDSYREKPPVANGYFDNKKQYSSSLVENQDLQYEQNKKWEQVRAAPLRKSTSQRREDNINYENKYDIQSQNLQQSSKQFSADFYSFQNNENKNKSGKQTSRYDQNSVQTQKIASIPPIPVQKIMKKGNKINENQNESNFISVQNINREFDQQSQKTARTHYNIVQKNQLQQQTLQQDNSYENQFSQLQYQNTYIQNKFEQYVPNQKHEEQIYINQLAFQNSAISQNCNIVSPEAFQVKPSNFDLKLKSNFAKKSFDAGIDKQEKSIERFSPQPTSILNIHSSQTKINQDFNAAFQKIQSYQNNAINIAPQSSSFKQNCSVYGEIKAKTFQESSVVQKDQKVQNENKNYVTVQTINTAGNNKDKMFQISSPNQAIQNVQQFTPFYKNNYNQNISDYKPIEMAFQDLNQKLQLKSKFALNNFEDKPTSLNRQIINEQKFDVPKQKKHQQKLPNSKSLKSSPSQISLSDMSKYSQLMKHGSIINEDHKNLNFDQKSQQQNQLNKMEQELKFLKQQFGDGLKSSNNIQQAEPKSGLLGNKRDYFQNQNCMSQASDIYIEQININSHRLDEMPPIEYNIKDQSQLSKNEGFNKNLNSLSSLSQKTYQTKPNYDKQHFAQEQNIKISQNSIDSKSEFTNQSFYFNDFNQQQNLKKKFQQLKDELNMLEDGKISEDENDSNNTYVSIKEQADIISQLRSTKNPLKKY